jgi:malonyl-CoA/methylmalonyl-CoA synthetase
LIVYTSGTTGKPKGVVHTHKSLEAQISSLVDAWRWSGDDKILNVLPMHHVHGIVNILNCSLYSGADCHMHSSKFYAKEVTDRLAKEDFTVFMAVPTIYGNLTAHIKSEATKDVNYLAKIKERFSKYRLMVSGSAALPETLFREWEEFSGQRLLERFGMTELGMALSNPYDIHGRVPG